MLGKIETAEGATSVKQRKLTLRAVNLMPFMSTKLAYLRSCLFHKTLKAKGSTLAGVSRA